MSATKTSGNPAKAAQAEQERRDAAAERAVTGATPSSVHPWRPRLAVALVIAFEVLFAWMVFAGVSMAHADYDQKNEPLDGLGSLLGSLVAVSALSPAVAGIAYLRSGIKTLFWVVAVAGAFDLAWMAETGFLVHL